MEFKRDCTCPPVAGIAEGNLNKDFKPIDANPKLQLFVGHGSMDENHGPQHLTILRKLVLKEGHFYVN